MNGKISDNKCFQGKFRALVEKQYINI